MCVTEAPAAARHEHTKSESITGRTTENRWADCNACSAMCSATLLLKYSHLKHGKQWYLTKRISEVKNNSFFSSSSISWFRGQCCEFNGYFLKLFCWWLDMILSSPAGKRAIAFQKTAAISRNTALFAHPITESQTAAVAVTGRINRKKWNHSR